MASGVIITMAYVVFEGSLIGIFAYFFRDFAATQFEIDVPWLVPAILMLVLNCVLTYFDVNLAAKVLGVFLITEIFMLSLGALAVLFRGGGPDGFAVAETLNPVGAFTPAAGIAGASAGIGLFFAFWSWVGFESTAMYGEESKDPKRIIPRATMISVLGVGIFYVFISWMAIAGTGPQKSVELAQDSATAGNIFFDPVQATYGNWAVTLFKLLLVTGSFACGMAFHNCASRYLYAMSREGLSAGLQKTLGATHHKHGSPHVASFVQTGITLVLILAFFVGGHGSVHPPVRTAGDPWHHGHPHRAVALCLRGDRVLPLPQVPPVQRALVQDVPGSAARAASACCTWCTCCGCTRTRPPAPHRARCCSS